MVWQQNAFYTIYEHIVVYITQQYTAVHWHFVCAHKCSYRNDDRSENTPHNTYFHALSSLLLFRSLQKAHDSLFAIKTQHTMHAYTQHAEMRKAMQSEQNNINISRSNEIMITLRTRKLFKISEKMIAKNGWFRWNNGMEKKNNQYKKISSLFVGVCKVASNKGQVNQC